MTFEEALKTAAEKVHERNCAPGRLSGKIAVVTGGAQGFGYGLAEEMYKEGASVVVADMKEDLGKEAAAKLGERAAFAYVNVADEESVKELMISAVEVM